MLRWRTIIDAMKLQQLLKLSKGVRTYVKTFHLSSHQKKLPPVPNFSWADICTNIRTHANFQGGQNILRKYVISHFSPPHKIHMISCGLICFYRFYESWDIQATDYMFILDSLPTSHWQHSLKPCLYSNQQAKPPTFQNMTHVIVIMTRLWSLALSLSL